MPTRYIVHGTDAVTGQAQHKIIEAESAGDAAAEAEALGVQVKGVEVDPSSVADTAPAAAAGAGAFTGAPPVGRLGPETTVWEGHPSQWINAGWFFTFLFIVPVVWGIWNGLTTHNSAWYLFCLLLVPIGIALWKALIVHGTRFTLTSERLRIQRGVLSKSLEEIELYRVKDTALHQSFAQRVAGLGAVELLTSDETLPTALLSNIHRPHDVREAVRRQVEAVRRARGVRELDVAETAIPRSSV